MTSPPKHGSRVLTEGSFKCGLSYSSLCRFIFNHCLPLLWLLFSCPVMSDSLLPTDCSTPGLPVPHHLSKFAQVHGYSIRDAIQASHPLTPYPLPSIFPSITEFSSQSLFTSDDQNTGISTASSILSRSIQG